MNYKISKKYESGFTLIELLVVIAIIGVLAIVAVPALFKQIEKARVSKLESDYTLIKDAALAYYYDNGKFPTQTQYLNEQMETIPQKNPFGGKYSFSIDNNTLSLIVGIDYVQPSWKQGIPTKINKGQLIELVTQIGNSKVTKVVTLKNNRLGNTHILDTKYYSVKDNVLDEINGLPAPSNPINMAIILIDGRDI